MGRAQPIVGDAIPGLVIPGPVKKQTEQPMRSTPFMTHVSAFISKFWP